jgi:riboflavin synthase
VFTGIVEERGTVDAPPPRLAVSCRTVTADSPVGASVAVNGVCLTVIERSEDRLVFDVTGESLDRSTLGGLRSGDQVNLERPVTLLTRLGGHLVQGHVDAVGIVVTVEPNALGATLVLRVPAPLGPYVVEKGAVAVDGVALTVASVEEEMLSIALIPHTLEVTTLGSVRPGDPVNLEVDVIAKYVEVLVGKDGR